MRTPQPRGEQQMEKKRSLEIVRDLPRDAVEGIRLGEASRIAFLR